MPWRVYLGKHINSTLDGTPMLAQLSSGIDLSYKTRLTSAAYVMIFSTSLWEYTDVERVGTLVRDFCEARNLERGSFLAVYDMPVECVDLKRARLSVIKVNV